MTAFHEFILKPGSWVGEGKIILNMVSEELPFKMHWNISEKDKLGKVQCVQHMQIQGLSEEMRNEMLFFNFAPQVFTIEMENSNIGRVVGTGVCDAKVIAWEFRENDLNFEGFESYRLQEDGTYLLHGEYITIDQLRTQIDGKIWRKQ